MKDAKIPVLAIFNAVNNALMSAEHRVDCGLYDEAGEDVAVAKRLVRILQSYSPEHGLPDPPSTSLKWPSGSYYAVKLMFEYQLERWRINKTDLDE